MMMSTMFSLLAAAAPAVAPATMPTTAPSAIPSEHGFFYPIQASTIAGEVDPLAWFIHGVSIFFTVAIIAATVYFAIRYRASVHPVPQPPGHNNLLEVIWTGIPAIIVFVCFFWGFRVYMRMTVQQPGATQVEAVGKQWFWQFVYDDPKTGAKVQGEELYLVENVPVEISLRSDDVIHSLFIPTMRMKKDVVPGRFNTMHLEPNKLGTFEVFCTEYCGDSHSTMLSKVHVVTQAEYDAKIAEFADVTKGPNGPLPPDQIGQKIARLNGCFSCHSVDGTTGTGPTWRDLYGATGHQLADGSAITVDDNYIYESIRNPNAKVAKGFGPPSSMNPYPKGQISDEYLAYIVAYQKSISQYAPKQAAGGPATTTADRPGGQPNTDSPKAAVGESNDVGVTQEKK